MPHLMAATEIISHTGELRHRRLGFNCNGTLTGWTVGARMMGDYHQNAAQIIIRSMQFPSRSPHIYTTALSSLNATSYLNVYEYELHPKLLVSHDLYIAVNSTQIYSQRCGLMNEQSGRCKDRPLVVVDAGKSVFH